MRLLHFSALTMAAFLTWSSLARPTVLGVVVEANRAHLNTTAVTAGATVYDGDQYITETRGTLSLQGGTTMLRLGGESMVTVRSKANGAPGTEAEVGKGTVWFSARGSTIEIVTLGARIRPIADTRAIAQVSVAGPKELRIRARLGSLQFSYRGETETISEGNCYRVILDPPRSDPKENGPQPPNRWPKGFKVVIIAEAAAVVGLGIYELREPESPDRP